MNNDFSIELGDKSRIKYHGTHTEQDFTVTLADTGANCMTGGRIHKIERYIDGDTFLLTYGDGVIDVNIGELARFHKSHGRIATVTTVSQVSRFGLIDLAESGRVSSFAEKPKTDGWVNAGDRADRWYSITLAATSIRARSLGAPCIRRQLMGLPRHGFFYAMTLPESASNESARCVSPAGLHERVLLGVADAAWTMRRRI